MVWHQERDGGNVFPDKLENLQVIAYTDKGEYGYITFHVGKQQEYTEKICFLAICKHYSEYSMVSCDFNKNMLDKYLCQDMEEAKDVANAHKMDIVWNYK